MTSCLLNATRPTAKARAKSAAKPSAKSTSSKQRSTSSKQRSRPGNKRRCASKGPAKRTHSKPPPDPNNVLSHAVRPPPNAPFSNSSLEFWTLRAQDPRYSVFVSTRGPSPARHDQIPTKPADDPTTDALTRPADDPAALRAELLEEQRPPRKKKRLHEFVSPLSTINASPELFHSPMEDWPQRPDIPGKRRQQSLHPAVLNPTRQPTSAGPVSAGPVSAGPVSVGPVSAEPPVSAGPANATSSWKAYVAQTAKFITGSDYLAESPGEAVSAEPAPPVKSRRKRGSLHAKIMKDRAQNVHAAVICDERSRWSVEKFEWDREIQEVNRRQFGNQKFLAIQREAINATLSGRDVFVMLPTGGGKSLCYQLPALMTPGVTIVVMPLISLMTDQRDYLTSIDVESAILSSQLSREEVNEVFHKCITGVLKVLFVTPEKIGASSQLQDFFRELSQNGRLDRFVIDEAHCVSQWGNDFRPEYRGLGQLRQQHPSVPILALTASATLEILDDVIKQLKMKETQLFRRSFDRTNLRYKIVPRMPNAVDYVSDLVKNRFIGLCGILYCLARNECDNVAAELRMRGIQAESYHGGMASDLRDSVQRRWMAEEFEVIVATIAFGMGINKKDVRFVIHLAMPKCLENFYQESGRAGRDGEVSECICFWDMSDKQRHLWLMKHGGSLTAQGEKGLTEMLNFCQNVTTCRRVLILKHFGEEFQGTCHVRCDNCSRTETNRLIKIECESEVRRIVDFVTEMNHKMRGNYEGLTLLDLSNILIGKKIKKSDKIHDRGIHSYQRVFQSLKTWPKKNVLLLLQQLINRQILKEKLIPLPKGVCHYIFVGSAGADGFKEIHVPLEEVPLESGRFNRDGLSESSRRQTSDAGFSDLSAFDNGISECESRRDSVASHGSDDSIRLIDSIGNNGRSDPNGDWMRSDPNGDWMRSGRVDHDEKALYEELVRMRKELVEEYKLKDASTVLTLNGLKKLAKYAPTRTDQLKPLNIPGLLSKPKIERYGTAFCKCIAQFLRNHRQDEPTVPLNRAVSSNCPPVPPNRPPIVRPPPLNRPFVRPPPPTVSPPMTTETTWTAPDETSTRGHTSAAILIIDDFDDLENIEL